YLIALPAAAYILLLLATLPGSVAFSIDAANRYIPGIAYTSSYIWGLLYIAAAASLILAKRKALNRGEIIPYLLIPAIPVALAIGEILFAPLTGLMWAGTSLVILEIQMLVLNNRTNIDHLTSLNNRMALDAYLRRMIHESHTTHMRLGVMMIDVDDFKSINDRFGHVEGDRALKVTADILREAFSGSFFIARYGGDEFTIVLKDCDDGLMAEYREKLEAQRIRQNERVNRPYEIMLSIGSWVFSDQEITSLHSLYMKVDGLMYTDKNAKKSAKTEAAP
ncbi:MAG: GGDEF domain-containing protein, partial [Firmicutes bacterium]|nr:GGDEF domain-containing protein [Bacillota bacterium]